MFVQTPNNKRRDHKSSTQWVERGKKVHPCRQNQSLAVGHVVQYKYLVHKFTSRRRTRQANQFYTLDWFGQFPTGLGRLGHHTLATYLIIIHLSRPTKKWTGANNTSMNKYVMYATHSFFLFSRTYCIFFTKYLKMIRFCFPK